MIIKLPGIFLYKTQNFFLFRDKSSFFLIFLFNEFFYLIICIIMKIKILANSVPLSGHYTPLSRLVSSLSKDPQLQITFSTSSHQMHKLKLGDAVLKFNLHDETQKIKQKAKWDELPNTYFDAQWEPQLQDYIQKQNPDLVICDLFSFALMKLSKKYNITTIIYLPIPTSFFNFINIPLLKKNFNLFGFPILYNDQLNFLIPKKVRSFLDVGKYFDSSLVLVSSFFGLEEPITLPPNIKLIGQSLYPYQKPEAIDQNLQNWINKLDKNLDIVYVTFGSLIRPTQTYIDFLYEGLKKLKIGVIWSLPQGELPEQNSNFYMKKWLPQIDILNMERVKVVITHCGWGGLNQSIQGKKPMLCVPSYGDQSVNADLIIKNGIGLLLGKPKKVVMGLVHLSTPNFSHQELSEKINMLRNDDKVKARLKKLNEIASQFGGLEEACRLVKNAGKNGIEHWLDKDAQKLRKKQMKILYIALLMVLAYFIFFSNSLFRTFDL